MIFTSVSAFLSAYDLVDTADNWNLHCVSQNSVQVSNFYYSYYLYTFILLFVLACLTAVKNRLTDTHFSEEHARKSARISVSRLLGPGFCLCLIIAFWFSVGDGAPPNDRYALLHYVIWSSWTIGVLCQSLTVSKRSPEPESVSVFPGRTIPMIYKRRKLNS